jgi:hypothetical protein
MSRDPNTHGGIKVMSVLDPHPAQVGLTRVVSTIVHPSPLKPHLPIINEEFQYIDEMYVNKISNQFEGNCESSEFGN